MVWLFVCCISVGSTTINATLWITIKIHRYNGTRWDQRLRVRWKRARWNTTCILMTKALPFHHLTIARVNVCVSLFPLYEFIKTQCYRQFSPKFSQAQKMMKLLFEDFERRLSRHLCQTPVSFWMRSLAVAGPWNECARHIIALYLFNENDIEKSTIIWLRILNHRF